MGVEDGPASVEDPWTYYWGDWVLANGLPDLPKTLSQGEAVPVAYWRGEQWAAVLELRHRPTDPDPGGEPEGLDTDVQAYRWNGWEWEAAGATGGGSWSDDLRIQGNELPLGEAARLGHGRYGCREWVAGVAYGIAGKDARSVEVEQHGGVVSRSIESPLRAWAVAFDGRHPAIVRVRSDRWILLEDVVEAVDW